MKILKAKIIIKLEVPIGSAQDLYNELTEKLKGFAKIEQIPICNIDL